MTLSDISPTGLLLGGLGLGRLNEPLAGGCGFALLVGSSRILLLPLGGDLQDLAHVAHAA